MNSIARQHPLLREQLRAEIRRKAISNAIVVAEPKKHVVSGRAGKIAIGPTRCISEQESLITAERQELADDVGIQERAFYIDLRARRERRVAVFSNDPRSL